MKKKTADNVLNCDWYIKAIVDLSWKNFSFCCRSCKSIFIVSPFMGPVLNELIPLHIFALCWSKTRFNSFPLPLSVLLSRLLLTDLRDQNDCMFPISPYVTRFNHSLIEFCCKQLRATWDIDWIWKWLPVLRTHLNISIFLT
jgi:hypothetical protein